MGSCLVGCRSAVWFAPEPAPAVQSGPHSGSRAGRQYGGVCGGSWGGRAQQECRGECPAHSVECPGGIEQGGCEYNKSKANLCKRVLKLTSLLINKTNEFKVEDTDITLKSAFRKLQVYRPEGQIHNIKIQLHNQLTNKKEIIVEGYSL